jgi:ferritin
MIPDKISKAFNEQIMHEFYSAYLYLSMAAWLETEGLEGMGRWMRVQAMEEMTHAMKFFDHILERGGEPELLAIEKPPVKWASPLAAFENALAHEQFISGKINELMTLSLAESDHASKTMLQWFVDEQVEEEDSASKNVYNLKMVGDKGQGLLMVDREMGARVFKVPLSPEFGSAAAG